MNEKLKESAQLNAGTFAFGTTVGALTHKTITAQQTHLWRSGGLAAQVGSAVGVAAAGGAGVGGSVAAGAAVITAKVAAVAAFGAAAAPFVLTAGAGYGIYQLLKKL